MKKSLKSNFLFSKLLLFCSEVLFLLVSVKCNMSDNAQELSGQYFYRDEGTEMKQILSHLPNRKEIYSTIIDYDFNSHFIVAVQKPNYEDYKNMVGFKLRDDLKKYPTNSEKDVAQSEGEADSILKNDPFYKNILAHKLNYWIIVNERDTVFEPLTKQEYQNMRTKLEIPKSVRISTLN